jgi:hypothetical protein
VWLNVLVSALVWAPISVSVQFVESRRLSRSADWSVFWQVRGSIPKASQKFCFLQKFLSLYLFVSGGEGAGVKRPKRKAELSSPSSA